MNGLVLVDKPKGISSFGVVSRIRGTIKAHTGQKLKVGHSGTLDPAATGLLVIAIGKYTKRIPELIKQDKTYQVEMILGQISTTGDIEGQISKKSDSAPSLKSLKDTLTSFEGDIMQTPPIYSAIKINGQRAYKLAREGKEVKMVPRPAHINSISLVDYNYPKVSFLADVASGTYIRSLVEDIGKNLNTGAYMSELRRTIVGNFDINIAMNLNDLNYSKIEKALFTLES